MHDSEVYHGNLLTSDLKWNRKRLEEILPSLASQIQTIRPSTKGAEDIFVWQPLQSGVYSAKSGYSTASALKHQHTPQEENQEFRWVKDIWSGLFSPKLKVFLWSTIQKALPTGENLQNRGITSDLTCPRCKKTETVMHIFFNCTFARKVWEAVPLRQAIPISAEDTITSMMVKFRRALCLPPTGVQNPILPWILWSIWTARNKLLFEDRNMPPEEIASGGIRLAREWNQAQEPKNSPKKSVSAPEVSIDGRTTSRNHSGDSAIICTTDASWDATSKRAGLAWIFKESNGTIATQGSEIQHSVSSPLMAEALAIRSSLVMAVEHEIPNLRIYSDSLTLIRAINTKMHDKEIYGILCDIHQISSVFGSISFSFLPRSKNREADELAKRCLRSFSFKSCIGPIGLNN
ncbi:uncharacterized protein LOC108869886 [Brassica rapa]|uniref:uncharacterized protein LOC108869886 n=1 Tax=Brassica campestris TaxID=3711 RepID=UPI00142DB994|nr:uncharacterized protein LOC108869886 [Brassica rapa]